jgi:potassium-transporting ATPase potassium-binding subunit
LTFSGSFEIVLTLAFTIAAAYPIGSYMADVFENRRTFLAQIIGPIERAFYRLAGVKPDIEQEWHEYAIAMVLFSGVCMFGLYALLRLQGWLPLNPQGFPGVPPDLAFNIAVSFVTNTNWQAYDLTRSPSPWANDRYLRIPAGGSRRQAVIAGRGGGRLS